MMASLRIQATLLAALCMSCGDAPTATPDAAVDGPNPNLDAPTTDAPVRDGGTDGAAAEPIVLAVSTASPSALVLSDGYVYWADYGTFGSNGMEQNAAISRVPIAGGSVEPIITGLYRPRALAVSAGYVYWIAEGSTTGSVNRALISGGAVDVLAPNQAGPGELAVDSTNVYWTNVGNSTTAGAVMKCALSGCSPTAIAPGQAPLTLVLDANTLYWADFGDSTIRSISVNGGTPVVLATQQWVPYSLAVDSTSIYIANEGQQGFVAKAPLQGGGATTLVTMHHCFGIAVDSQSIYFGYAVTGVGAIFRIPVGGGSVTMFAASQGGAGRIAVDATAVYWIDGGYPSSAGAILKAFK